MQQQLDLQNIGQDAAKRGRPYDLQSKQFEADMFLLELKVLPGDFLRQLASGHIDDPSGSESNYLLS